MTTMRVVGECFFWYRLTRVFPDKFHRAVKRLCVCVLSWTTYYRLPAVMHYVLLVTCHCHWLVLLLHVLLIWCDKINMVMMMMMMMMMTTLGTIMVLPQSNLLRKWINFRYNSSVLRLYMQKNKYSPDRTEVISWPWPWSQMTLKVILSWMSHRPLTSYPVSLRSDEKKFLSIFWQSLISRDSITRRKFKNPGWEILNILI